MSYPKLQKSFLMTENWFEMFLKRDYKLPKDQAKASCKYGKVDFKFTRTAMTWVLGDFYKQS
jgi:hypothetical protein